MDTVFTFDVVMRPCQQIVSTSQLLTLDANSNSNHCSHLFYTISNLSE